MVDLRRFDSDPRGDAQDEHDRSTVVGSHGSAEGSDPFRAALSKEESKQLLFSGKQADADQYLFVLDDKLEATLGEMNFLIAVGRYLRARLPSLWRSRSREMTVTDRTSHGHEGPQAWASRTWDRRSWRQGALHMTLNGGRMWVVRL